MWQRLGDVAQVSTGYAFRGKINADEDGDVIVLQIKDVTAGPLNLADALRTRGDYERHYLMSGDLLMQARGSQHPVALFAAHPRCIAAAGLHVIRADATRVRPEYLAWFFNHPNAQAKLKGGATSSSVPFIAKGDLEDFQVAVPPLATQDRLIEVSRLQRHESELAERLSELRRTHIDTLTWQVATSGAQE